MKKRFWSIMPTACLLAGVLAAGNAGGALAAAPMGGSTVAAQAQACDPPRGFALYTMAADGTAVEPLTSWTGDAYNAAWSPDGTKVAFTGIENCVPKLRIVTMDDPEPTAILPNDAAAAGPTWSPDGSHLAFGLIQADGTSEVFVANAADGANPVNVTNHPGTDVLPAWSPDGDRIAYVSRRDGSSDIYVKGADGTELRLTDDPGDERSPTWSPDGSQIAYIADDGLWVVDADGGNRRWIIVEGVVGISVSWSPAGDRFALSANAGGNVEVFTMNVDGTDLRNVSNHPASDVLPNWSPDGTRLVFSSDRDAEADR